MQFSKYFGGFVICCAGFILRLALLKSSLTNSLGSRIEISTPLNSWKRAVEGVHLWKQGINPYDSDIFHESPLGLFLYDCILTYAKHWIPTIFALCDIFTALLLSLTSRIYLQYLINKEKKLKTPESSLCLLLKSDNTKWIPLYVAAIYLLCPYSILSCAGKSTVTFQNLILATYILCSVSGMWILASILLAISSCHSFYHIAFLVSLLMLIYEKDNYSNNYICYAKLISIFITFIVSSALLLFYFYKKTESWHFLENTYGSILSVPDLTPNIGLFWYFFTEMFEHFRVFFLFTFQLNIFIYIAPLAIRLRKEPCFVLFTHLIIIAIFKSYPCIGDVAFYLSLLPTWTHLFRFMKQRFIVSCVLASCTLLAPTLWHLWIYSGSANANFYFAITLAFNTGQVFLLTDVVSAFTKREYYLEKGLQENKDGSLSLLKLK